MVAEVKLSIIVPVYNVSPYLKACLESVCFAADRLGAGDQGLGLRWEAEVVCVDDGSTDGSGEILDDFARRSRNLVVIHQENAGVSAARNAGLKAATGDWVTFVDADDCVARNRFAVVAKIIVENPGVGLVRMRHITSVWSDDEMEKWRDAPNEPVGSLKAYRGEDARTWGYWKFAMHGWPFANFVRRDVIGDLRFADGVRMKEDVLFFLNIVRNLDFAIEADYVGYFYRRRRGSALMSFRRTEDCLRFAKEMLALKHVPVQVISRSLGYDLIQWSEERDWSDGYDGTSCPLRALWRENLRNGKIDMRGIYPWWRPGIRAWMRWGGLGLLRLTWKLRRSI